MRASVVVLIVVLLSGCSRPNAEIRETLQNGLVQACAGGDVESVKKLLNLNIDPNADVRGQTALDTTAEFFLTKKKQMLTIAEMLLDHGADVNRTAYSGGETPLMTAVGAGDEGIEMVTFLLGRGADVNLQDSDGKTALIYAAHAVSMSGFTGVTQALLSAGARVDTTDKNGNTALIYAAKQDKRDMMAMLLKAGADVNTKNQSGETALIAAAKTFAQGVGESSTIEFLLKRGANASIRTTAGQSAVDAITHGPIASYPLRRNEMNRVIASLRTAGGR